MSDAQSVEDKLTYLINETVTLEQEALKSLRDAISSKEVEVFRVLYLGKNGKITAMMKEMRLLKKEALCIHEFLFLSFRSYFFLATG